MQQSTGVRRFRPRPRQRARLATGLALGAVAVAGNVLVYTSVDRRASVLQVVRDVPAGAVVTADDLRPVEVGTDPSVRTVDADDLALVVGAYAKVRLVAGSLMVVEAVQSEPLVADGSAVVAIRLPEGSLPVGLRERSRVRLVVPAEDGAPAEQVDGRVVGLPATSSVTDAVSLSVEVPEAMAAVVATGADVRVVLLHPVGDPADVAEVTS